MTLNARFNLKCSLRTARLAYVCCMGALQRGPGGPWPSQNFGWVGHNAFGPTNSWPVCSLILHCGQLILRKISKIGASRYHILRPKCTKFTFCWGSAPDPAGEAYSAPRTLPLFKGPGSFPAGTPGNGVPKVILTVGTAFPGTQ